MSDKKDIFYFAKYYGIPCYFQPEECEVIGRNKLYDFLISIMISVHAYFGENFQIVIEHKTITRQEIHLCSSDCTEV